MNFANTYSEEVLQSRRDRSRRAFFWARVLSFVLMITFAATLRADPKLRNLLMESGMDAIAAIARVRDPQPDLAALAASVKPEASTTLPTSRIKVNRFGATAPTDAQSITQGSGDSLSAQTRDQ